MECMLDSHAFCFGHTVFFLTNNNDDDDLRESKLIPRKYRKGYVRQHLWVI